MNVYPQVLGSVRLLKDVAMDVAGSFDDVSLICDMQYLALLGMEFHLPVYLPLLKLIEVFLKLDGIFLTLGLSIEDTVVSKQLSHCSIIIISLTHTMQDQRPSGNPPFVRRHRISASNTPQLWRTPLGARDLDSMRMSVNHFVSTREAGVLIRI